MQVMEGHAGHVWHLLGSILALESIGPNGVELPGPATVLSGWGNGGADALEKMMLIHEGWTCIYACLVDPGFLDRCILFSQRQS